MAADEAGTLARLKRIRSDVIDPEIAGSGGEIVKLTGDGMLVLFRSVAAAVEAATAVQKAVASAEAGAPADHRIAFRIGLHLGDVMLDGGEIYGDGVNVAARLEAIAEPCGTACPDRPLDVLDLHVAEGFVAHFDGGPQLVVCGAGDAD